MRLYSEKYSAIPQFQIWTYDEAIVVKDGFAEVAHPNSIAILKTRRKGGFVEAPLRRPTEAEMKAEKITPSTSPETVEAETPEEIPFGEQTKKRPLTFTLEEPSEEKGDVQNPVESPVEEVALTMGDVDAIVKKSSRGSRKKSGPKRTTGRRKG